MVINDLHELFVHKLARRYYIEHELDEMARNTTNDRMSKGFANHRDETRNQVKRLENVFTTLDLPAEARDNPFLDGLENDRRAFEAQIEDDELINMTYLNAGMITERMEMTAYEGLITIAEKLGLGVDVQRTLDSNHNEEKSAFRDLERLTTAKDLKSLWDRLTPS